MSVSCSLRIVKAGTVALRYLYLATSGVRYGMDSAGFSFYLQESNVVEARVALLQRVHCRKAAQASRDISVVFR